MIEEHEDKEKLQVSSRVHGQLSMTKNLFHSFSKTLVLNVQPADLPV